MFFKKEIYLTRDLAAYSHAKERLEKEHIRYNTVTNSMMNSGRYHGMPGIRAEAAYEYRIFVKRKDYWHARRVLQL